MLSLKLTALTVLYNKYNHMMLSIAKSILNDHMYAEDAVQEAFMKLAKNINKVDDVSCSKTKNFIVTLCKSTAIDIYRKRQNISEIHEEFPLETENSICVSKDILERLISEEGFNELVNLIETLDPVYKETLKLKFIHKFSNDEIAELQNIAKKL